MAYNTRPLKRAQDGVAPQYYNPTTDEYEVLLGQDGAARAILYGPDGQPITNENPLEVRARLLEELLGALNATKETNPDASTATLLALLRGLLASVGKEATLAAIKDSDGIKKIADAVTVSGLENLATETKLEAVRALLALLEGKDFATDTKAEAIRLLLASLDGKDFASETTLAAMETELGLAKTELAAIKGMLTDGTAKGEVTLSGTLTEFFGAHLSDRPPANSVSVGATFMVVGDTVVYQSNGTDWVVISE